MMRNVKSCAISTVIGLYLVTASFDALAQTRHALLIGINDYKTEEFANLRGAVNDVITMREVLTSKYGFAESNVVVLTDSFATRANILGELDKLVAASSDDDMVYVHYSGHGSQVKDIDGDEDDSVDETILPHDARTEGIPDITDDEIADFLRRLSAKSAIVVLDSCHSGTATRGGIATRSVPADQRLELYSDSSADISTRAVVAIDASSNYILLSGAASHQSALDGPVKGKYRGFFSYALSEALNSVEPGASPREIHARVALIFQEISQQFGGIRLPEPQFEADSELLDAPLFPIGSAAETRKAFVSLQVIDEQSGNLVRGTTMDGVIGSHWAVFYDDEVDFSIDDSIGTAVVTSLAGLDSFVEAASMTFAPGKSYRAIRLPAASTPMDVSVRLELSDQGLNDDLENYLTQNVVGVKIVGPDDFARFVVGAEEGNILVYDAAGFIAIDEFTHSSVAKSGERLAQLLARSKTAVSLSQLTNDVSNLIISARIVGVGPEHLMRIRRPGQPRSFENSISLEIEVNRASYLTIIDVDSEGGVNVLFPNSYTKPGFLPDGFVNANSAVKIPDGLQPGNRAGFFWDYSPPAGLDTIQIFASTDLQTASKIRSWVDSLNTVASRGSSGLRDYSSALDDLKTSLAREVRTRTILVVQDTEATDPVTVESAARIGADWNSVSLGIQISE